jgi:hypothetical protein
MDDYNVYGDQYEIVGNEGGQSNVGYSEIIGELINPRPQGQLNPAVRQQLMGRVAQNMPVVRKIQPTQWRKWTTGIGPLGVPASTSATVSLAPQLLFKVKKVYLTDSYATPGYGTALTAVSVGQNNQLPNNTSIPTWAFGPGLLENAVDWDTCQGAYTMTFVFQNLTASALTVSGALYGLAIKNS